MFDAPLSQRVILRVSIYGFAPLFTECLSSYGVRFILYKKLRKEKIVMNVKEDLKEVSISVRKSIARFARKLQNSTPEIHTIIVDRRRGDVKAEKITDFELTIFFDAGSEEETKRIISESMHYSGSGAVSENYTVLDPEKSYVRSEHVDNEEGLKALLYKSVHLYKTKQIPYLEFIREHRKLFIKNDYITVSTMNSPEMEKSNPLFYKLYITHCYEMGHVVYNRLLKPFITMHNSEDLL